jgi:Fe-S-cluster containining protein
MSSASNPQSSSNPDDAPPLIQIENAHAARFRCVFPVCGGLCCKTGRPSVTPDDVERIRRDYDKFVPLMRPDVRRFLKRHPWLSSRKKDRNRTLSVAGGWCVFYNDGCILQKVGMDEGEPWRYKPDVCVRFPIEPVRNREGHYYVRQWEYRGEGWDLFCLNPAEDPTPVTESLKAEIGYLENRARGGSA